MAAIAGLVIGAGGAAFSAYSSISGAQEQAEALRAQGDYKAMMAEVNQKFAESAFTDAIKRGDTMANQVTKDAKRMIGSQRAAFAAQGIEVDSGSAIEIQADTADMSYRDATQIKINAMREAYGYKIEAFNASLEGRMAKQSSENAANSTLLTGRNQAIGAGFSGLSQGFSAYSKLGGSGNGNRSSGSFSGGNSAGGSYMNTGNIA